MPQRKQSAVGIALGRRVKQLRKARGLEQADLAAALPGETSRSLISYIETGRSFPTPGRLHDLAELFGVDVASLFLDGDDIRYRLARRILSTGDDEVLQLIDRMLGEPSVTHAPKR